MLKIFVFNTTTTTANFVWWGELVVAISWIVHTFNNMSKTACPQNAMSYLVETVIISSMRGACILYYYLWARKLYNVSHEKCVDTPVTVFISTLNIDLCISCEIKISHLGLVSLFNSIATNNISVEVKLLFCFLCNK